MVSPEAGQKTGFYCDQRDNRQLIRRLAKGKITLKIVHIHVSLNMVIIMYLIGKDVLDTYCYSGGFSINAAIGGANRLVYILTF